jgi:hypothetical protein
MELTLFEIHLDDVTFGGEPPAADEPDRRTRTEPVEPSEAEGTAESGPSRVVLALVPVFLALGVAAGFLAARRFGADRPPADEAGVDVELTTEIQ